MPLLTLKKLSVGYEKTAVAENIELELNNGDYLCIIGENGSGKSTLMRTLLGLLKPVSGEIIWHDAGAIGYLPQQTAAQRDFPASVREIVLSGFQAKLGHRPFYSNREKQKAFENMRRMGIEPLAKRCYRELSGGQQQRVLLSRALCAADKLLLLDEPVSGLDPIVTAEMYRLIAELNQSGMTVIMVSHDVEAAARYASHILHIGSSVFFGTKSEYLASELGRAFIGRGA